MPVAAEQQAQQSQALKMFSALLGQQGSGQAAAAANTAAADTAAAGGAAASSLQVRVVYLQGRSIMLEHLPLIAGGSKEGGGACVHHANTRKRGPKNQKK